MTFNRVLMVHEAEMLRQSHCDRQGSEHQCIGVVCIDKNGMSLDCKLCGTDTQTLEESTSLVQNAKALCNILEIDFLTLTPQKRRQFLLEVLAQNRLDG